MKAGIYTGALRHRRFRTRDHSFRYSVFMVLVNIDEPGTLFPARSLFWGQRRCSLVGFRRQDYLPGQPSLRAELCSLVERETGSLPEGSVYLLTNPRIFGFLINPISIYYCFQSDDQRLHSLVLEVTNTPWGERHRYVLPCDPARRGQRINFDKRLHVSPFLPMQLEYELRCNMPGSRVAVHLVNLENGQRVFDATLGLAHLGASSMNKLSVLLRFPLMTLKVWAGIHWQAVRLYLKGVPVVKHPGNAVDRS